MKKTFIIILIVLAAAVLALMFYKSNYYYFMRSDAAGWSRLERTYQWVIAQQRNNRAFLIIERPLVPSFEGGQDAFTYDQALAVIAFNNHGDFDRSRLVLDFYKDTLSEQKEIYGKFIGFSDAYKINGGWGETWAAGPNAWLLMAINNYTYASKDRQYLDMAEEIAAWLIALQSIEGGIVGGYYGTGEPMTWIATEHNFDCYCALRDLGILTGNEEYLKVAKDIKVWLEDDAWSTKQQRFYMGRAQFNRNYATDLSSWAVLSLGDRYRISLDFAMDKSLVKKYYAPMDIEVEGFDFGSTYNESPYPDKDAVWFEGTGQMVLAFEAAGMMDKCDYFLSQLDKALTPSPKYKKATGLPYASNEGTPAYGSWLMQDKPLCISSTTWYTFAKEGFNPFSMDQKTDENNKVITELDYSPAYQFVPVVDDFEYSRIKFETAYPEQLSRGDYAEIGCSLYENADKQMKITYRPEPEISANTGFIERPFFYEQDWSSYTKLTLSITADKSNKTKIIFRLKLEDREAEPYESGFLSLEPGETKELSYDIDKDLVRSSILAHYGNKVLDKDGIKSITFEVIMPPVKEETEGIIFIDDIALE